jgi:heterodisulfide reductase subunit A
VRRIAWVQCVGSRLRGPVDNGFCSGVCCSATLGQALALPQVERTLYAMDVRAHLPGSQALLDRALTEGVAVRYAWPHTLYPGPGGHGVCFRVSDTGAVRQETVDMVVLVVGTEVADLALEPARVAAVAMSRFRSVRTGCFEPSRTSRPGVLVAGGLAGPAEAATAVIQGAAAAWEVCHLGGLGTSTALAAQARVLVVGGGGRTECFPGLGRAGVPRDLGRSSRASGRQQPQASASVERRAGASGRGSAHDVRDRSPEHCRVS